MPRANRTRCARLAERAPAGFSKALLGAVDQGLEIAVANRPANLDDWLARLIGPGAVADPPDPPAPPRRRRGGAWVAGLGTALVLVAGGWLWLEFGGGPFEPDRIPHRATDPGTEEPVPDPETIATCRARSAVTGGSALLVVKTEPPGAEVLIGDTAGRRDAARAFRHPVPAPIGSRSATRRTGKRRWTGSSRTEW